MRQTAKKFSTGLLLLAAMTFLPVFAGSAIGQTETEEAERLNQSAEKLLGEAKYDEALEAAKRALAIREKTLGFDNPDLANSLSNLARIYRAKGDFANAESTFRRIVEIIEKKLGAEHREIIRPISNLATLYNEMGDYTRAEPLYQRALSVSEKKLEADHLLTAALLNNLAELYFKKGDFARAEPLHRRALAIREKKLGIEDPLVARSINNLAKIYDVTGDYDRAEPLYRRALAILEKALEADDPDIATPLNNLASLYVETGNLDRAEPLFQRSLKIYEKALGPEHQDLAAPLNNLGQLYLEKGNYPEAERLYQRSLTIAEKILGAKHPDVADTLSNLGNLYTAQGNIAQAIAVRTRANNIREYNLEIILTVGSENQKQLYAATLSDETDDTISLHYRSATDSKAAAYLAFTTILRRKGRVLDVAANQLGALRSRSNPQTKALFEQLQFSRSQLASLILDGPGDSSPAEYQSSLIELQTENERLEAAISSISAEFRAELQPVTIDRVQSAIPSNAALVEIVSFRPYNAKVKKIAERYGASRYAAYILRSAGAPSWVDLGETSVIDRDVARLRKALNDSQLTDPAAIKRIARALDAKLMFPIRRLLGNTRQVLLSPEGALNLLPFGALVDERGKYLIENYSFAYLTSGRDLLRMQVKGESIQSPSSRQPKQPKQQ
jgi:tetratricopeptide (TPR) repeat protein